QKRKPGNESYAGNAILSSAMKTDDLAWRNIRVSRNIIDVERELRIITYRDFDGLRSWSCALAGVHEPGHSRANARRQPVEHFVLRFTRFRNAIWVVENCHACVSRCKLDDAGNLGVLKLLKCPENHVQRLLRLIIESLAHTDDQRAISERNDF